MGARGERGRRERCPQQPLLTSQLGIPPQSARASVGALASETQTLKDYFQKGMKAFMCLLLAYFRDKFP